MSSIYVVLKLVNMKSTCGLVGRSQVRYGDLTRLPSLNTYVDTIPEAL